MFFWLLGILLIGGLGAAGRAVGALRYALVLLGLWISHFVAFGFAGKMTDYLLNKESKLENPLYAWILPPIIIYAISAIVFIIIAGGEWIFVTMCGNIRPCHCVLCRQGD